LPPYLFKKLFVNIYYFKIKRVLIKIVIRQVTQIEIIME